jgi:hypothetical protein
LLIILFNICLFHVINVDVGDPHIVFNWRQREKKNTDFQHLFTSFLYGRDEKSSEKKLSNSLVGRVEFFLIALPELWLVFLREKSKNNTKPVVRLFFIWQSWALILIILFSVHNASVSRQIGSFLSDLYSNLFSAWRRVAFTTCFGIFSFYVFSLSLKRHETQLQILSLSKCWHFVLNICVLVKSNIV